MSAMRCSRTAGIPLLLSRPLGMSSFRARRHRVDGVPRRPSRTTIALGNRSSRMVTFNGKLCVDLTIRFRRPITQKFPIDSNGGQACSSGH